jgi:hypothetical protein
MSLRIGRVPHAVPLTIQHVTAQIGIATMNMLSSFHFDQLKCYHMIRGQRELRFHHVSWTVYLKFICYKAHGNSLVLLYELFPSALCLHCLISHCL